MSARTAMSRAGLGIVLAGMLLAGSVDDVAAQTRPAPRAPRPPRIRWELGGGIVWGGGVDLGNRNAELTRNTGTGTGPFDLFATRSRLGSATGLQARVGVYVTRSIIAEGGLRYLRPVLGIRLTGDAESAPDQLAKETLTQYVIDGSAVVHLIRASFAGGRGVPFVAGGAGYIRDLHERNQLIQTGTEYHASGGVKWWLGTGLHRVGLRGEVGLSVRDGGFDLEATRRTVPIVGASVFYFF